MRIRTNNKVTVKALKRGRKKQRRKKRRYKERGQGIHANVKPPRGHVQISNDKYIRLKCHLASRDLSTLKILLLSA
jgi:hypothetical protein